MFPQFRRITATEKTFVRENYETLGAAQVAHLLGRTKHSIHHIYDRLDLVPLHRTDLWAGDEITFLKDNFAAIGLAACAVQLGRSKVAVGHKAARLGIRAAREAKIRAGATKSKRTGTQCIDSWKKAVKRRDDYTCQRCGLREPLIVTAHHKTHRSHGGAVHDINNGETLCPNCHAMEHALSGRRPSGKRYNFSDVQKCRELRAAGTTIDCIAMTLGMNPKTVLKFLSGA